MYKPNATHSGYLYIGLSVASTHQPISISLAVKPADKRFRCIIKLKTVIPMYSDVIKGNRLNAERVSIIPRS